MKSMTYKWLAKQYCGGDRAISLIFDTKNLRDKYLQEHDYCNANGKIRIDHIYDAGGTHFGIFVGLDASGNWIDTETNTKLDD